MNTRLITGAVAAVLVLTVAISIGFTEDAPTPKVEPLSEGEMWAESTKLGTPGPMHKDVLAKMVGDWEATGKIYMGGGEMPISGKSKHTSVMGGRFVHVAYEGPFMGGKFEGGGHIGYDNLAKKFQQTWVMTMSTNIDVMTGTYDEKTKTLTWVGKAEMPAKGGTITYKKRTTVCFKDDGSMHSESFATIPGGKEAKEMELTYTRAKKAASAAK